MTWMQTYSGGKFDLANPRPEDVSILDIAHHLSLICRFTGAVREFDSVAQHSVVVSNLVPVEHALTGLLHDAAEAYVTDLHRPLKKMLPDYQAIEDRVWREAIAPRFGLPPTLPAAVKYADNVSLMWERRDLLTSPPESWGEGLESITDRVPLERYVTWPSVTARRMFLRQYRSLTGEEVEVA